MRAGLAMSVDWSRPEVIGSLFLLCDGRTAAPTRRRDIEPGPRIMPSRRRSQLGGGFFIARAECFALEYAMFSCEELTGAMPWPFQIINH
jgi:hypothetical protein